MNIVLTPKSFDAYSLITVRVSVTNVVVQNHDISSLLRQLLLHQLQLNSSDTS